MVARDGIEPPMPAFSGLAVPVQIEEASIQLGRTEQRSIVFVNASGAEVER
jgi:hypothetical protein